MEVIIEQMVSIKEMMQLTDVRRVVQRIPFKPIHVFTARAFTRAHITISTTICASGLYDLHAHSTLNENSYPLHDLKKIIF